MVTDMETTTTHTLPTITGAMIHYGTPTVWVEPYFAAGKFGKNYIIHEFFHNGNDVFARGGVIRKDGTEGVRMLTVASYEVAIPANVREVSEALVEKWER